MQIVIDIPEDAYNYIKANGTRIPYYKLIDAIKSGTPLPKGLEAICDLAYSLSPEHRKIKNKVDTYDMLDGMTFDQIKAYVWEYEKLMNKIFDMINDEEEE